MFLNFNKWNCALCILLYLFCSTLFEKLIWVIVAVICKFSLKCTIPLYAYITIYSFILLLMNIWIIFSVCQLLIMLHKQSCKHLQTQSTLLHVRKCISSMQCVKRTRSVWNVLLLHIIWYCRLLNYCQPDVCEQEFHYDFNLHLHNY